ncbi:MAG: acyclic terpene utilization AtuA family protein [Pseudomonadota bacterium]|nr:acyclic terpene utilization AtuA family protein [Pseudomonadota bacterium]
MKPIRMFAATGMLGYGYAEESIQCALEMDLDLIAADAGSMDPGPYYLGAGQAFVSRPAAKRDLSLMMEGGAKKGVPVFIGSAGGGGGDPHVDWLMEIVREIATEKGLHPKVAVIRSEQSKDALKAKARAGKISPLGPIGELTEDEIEGSHRVVAMMGPEPFQKALEDGADVVIAGRASDAAIYAAIPLMRGADAGLAWHLGKIIECGAQVVEPREGQDCVIGTLYDDYFTIEPGHPERRCTRTRVAAHTLYENPSPYLLKEPNGTLNTQFAAFEQVDPRTVRVSGSRWEPATQYTVKLEGVRSLGYRTVFMAGIRDPILVSTIDEFISACRQRTARDVAALGIVGDDYTLNIQVYGRNAVMGINEPIKESAAHELAVLVDVVALSEDISKAVCAKARYSLLHTDFPGRMCISGNLAIPFSPSDIPAGTVYEFNIWHTMTCSDSMEPVRLAFLTPGSPETSS